MSPQKNEVNSSYHMELEGLKRGISWLNQNGINLDTLITDRHSQVTKWVREELTDVTHYFDVWHIAKGTQ